METDAHNPSSVEALETGHIREETTKIIHNYLDDLSIGEVVDILSEISEADEFPDLVIDWFDLIENYIEARHQSE